MTLRDIDIPDSWTHKASGLVARGGDLAAEAAGRAAGRVRDEARAFAKREQDHIDAVTAFVTSPAAQLVGAAALGFVVGLAVNPARKAAVQGVEAVAGDWLAVLKAEHRMVEAQLEALLKTTAKQKVRRAALLAKIKRALTKHALQEETVIYPAVKERQADGMAKHLYSDHADLKIFIRELEDLAKDDASFIERVRAFQACVAHHVREEEDEVFPRFHRALTAQENGRLTQLMLKEGVQLA
jgi:hemerythrin superfamily protein